VACRVTGEKGNQDRAEHLELVTGMLKKGKHERGRHDVAAKDLYAGLVSLCAQLYLYLTDTRKSCFSIHLLGLELLNGSLQLRAGESASEGLALDTTLPQDGDGGGLNAQLLGSSGDKAELDLVELDIRTGLGAGLLDHAEQRGGFFRSVGEDDDDDAVGLVLHNGRQEGLLAVGTC
jgi:hypothetical protein